MILLGSGWAWAQYRSFAHDSKWLVIPQVQTDAGKRNIDGSDQNILIVGNDDRSTATPAELHAL
ncbi:MAG: hypothetical protein QOE89_2172, partial [Pseudonocardiales bacterium]|nr:hypothetical protein [Pseudonocardiales bacterium]